eukprot:CAMPEP_0168525636 /NCGR_PEP_ID=MMETSP0405-20121227/11431_1 /TAXON_ID=498012 /ORGANISM="Trichosphaerium sp, Strain Am-I-7 wt" /LENGTH=401 /DNA_ID=CAMNT_0008548207 /DNA_START=138 /DNA_END=1343 /DNA_ORIENTATION=+
MRTWSFGGDAYEDARQKLEDEGHTVDIIDTISPQTLSSSDVFISGVMDDMNEEEMILDWVSLGNLVYIMCDRAEQSYCDTLFPDITAIDIEFCDCSNDADNVYLVVEHPLFTNYTVNDQIPIEGRTVRFNIDSTSLQYTVLASHEQNSVVPAIIEVSWDLGKVILIGDGGFFSDEIFGQAATQNIFINAVNKAQEIISGPPTTMAPTTVPPTTTAPTTMSPAPFNRGLVVASDIVIVETTTIVGNLTIINNSNLQISQDTVVTVTGCLETGNGTLEIQFDNTIPDDGEEREFIEYMCIDSTFSGISAVTSDQCKDIGIASSEYSATSLSVVFSVKDTCSQSSSGGGIKWWGVLLIVIVVVGLAIAFVVTVYFVKPLRDRLMPFEKRARARPRELDLEETEM